jgi:hypothetical protein
MKKHPTRVGTERSDDAPTKATRTVSAPATRMKRKAYEEQLRKL